MGTGVGEMALLQAAGIGAATGAGTAAITGGDPLKGALIGGLTAGAGHGFAGMGAAGGGAGAAEAANLATTGADAGANLAAQGSQMVQLPVTGDVSYSSAFTGPQTGVTNFGVERFGTPFYDNLANTAVEGGTSTAAQAATQPAATSPTALGQFYAKNPIAMPAGLGALGATIGAGPDTSLPGQEEYSGPLSRFSYDPRKYRAAAAGGLMDTEPARRMAAGGLGSYSDGGQTLKGPGDGMSDSIPASIGGSQPARLADGEFVVPADVVSGLGNGSTDAGARQLYAMMDAVRKARTGTDKQAPEIDSDEYMPA